VNKDNVESPEACALKVRDLLKAGPREGDHGAAALAEEAIRKLAAFLPSGAAEEANAKQLIVDLRAFFLSPRPFSQDTVALNRRHLTRRVKMLHQAVLRHALQSELLRDRAPEAQAPAEPPRAAGQRKA
jgi:hypothetical protein